mgnify:CR=1 FL=1
MVIEISATKRSVLGKGVNILRAAGTMPAVIYGSAQESTPIELNTKEFTKAFATAGESSVIALSIDGTVHNVLVNDVDRDPITDAIRHADFYAIVKGQKVEVSVPLVFKGESPAVKAGANLIKNLHEIEIEADPANLPHDITVDISTLTEIGSHITVKDLPLPTGVELITDLEDLVVSIVAAVEEEEVPVLAPDMSAIGISEERGKKPEEEGAAA